MVGFVVSLELTSFVPHSGEFLSSPAGQIGCLIACGYHLRSRRSLLFLIYQNTGNTLGYLLEFFTIINGYLTQ